MSTETLSDAELTATFQSRVSKWKSERNNFSSDPTELAMAFPYQQFIGMGSSAIPLIFAELSRSPDHWFWALHALTGAEPVKPEHQGRFDLMVHDWLLWGGQNGYVSSTTKSASQQHS